MANGNKSQPFDIPGTRVVGSGGGQSQSEERASGGIIPGAAAGFKSIGQGREGQGREGQDQQPQDGAQAFDIPGTKVTASGQTPNIGEHAEGFAAGAKSGLLDTGSVVAGMAAGASLGAMAGGVGAVPGALVGGALGFAAGETARRGFGIPRVHELPKEQRAAGFAGEVIAGSLPIGGGIIVAGRQGVRFGASRVGRFFNQVLEEAATKPKRFAAREAQLAISAGTAAGVAEQVAPGETGKRITAEIVAGVANPISIALRAGDTAIDVGRRFAQRFSGSAVESRAGRELVDIIINFGENPQKLARALRESDALADTVTSAQISGSPALRALEAELVKSSGRFGREAQKRAETSLENLRRVIGALEETGDPNALLDAATARKTYFDTLLDMRISNATDKAVEAAGKLSTDTPEARRELSTRMVEIVDGALQDMRTVERELWGKVAKDVPIDAGTIRSRRAAIEEELLEGELSELLPASVLRELDNLGEESVDAGKILRLRSRLLGRARDAAGSGNFDSARVLGSLAEAALDDLEGVAGADMARSFSRELNDRFTRTFAGDLLAKSQRGGLRQPPELAVKRALTGGADARDIRLDELDAALRMAIDRSLSPQQAEGAQAAIDEMMNIQSRMLRLAGSEAVDPTTGQISLRRLAKFQKDNSRAIRRLGLEGVFDEPAQAQRFLESVKENAKRGAKVIRERAAFSQLTQTENAVQGVSDVLRSRRPVERVQQLARMARSHGPEAVSGLRRAMFDETFEKAGGLTERFSFDSYRRLMFEPRRAGEKPVSEMMQEAGIMSAEETGRLREVLDQASQIEQAIRAGTDPDILLNQQTAAFDFATRILGANLATASPLSPNNGASLVVAGAGRRAAQQVLARVPNQRVRDVLVKAALDPGFMSLLLTKTPTPAGQIRIAKQLNAGLLAAGIIEVSREVSDEVETPEFAPNEPDRNQRQSAPTRGNRSRRRPRSERIPAMGNPPSPPKQRQTETTAMQPRREPQSSFAGSGVNLSANEGDDR